MRIPVVRMMFFFLGWSDTPKEEYLGKDLGFGIQIGKRWLGKGLYIEHSSVIQSYI